MMYGLRDEQLMPTPTTLSAPMEPPKAAKVQPAPKKDMRKFEGTFLQGGEDATEEFEMLAPHMVARLITRYEEDVLGGEFPPSERPFVAQVSALRARLVADKNPASDFGCFGSYGDRAARATSGMPDIRVGVRNDAVDSEAQTGTKLGGQDGEYSGQRCWCATLARQAP